jgi:hypothetical protein
MRPRAYGEPAQTGAAVTQPPEAEQYPTIEGNMHGGLAWRHGGSIVQRSPQALPAHASAEQLK